MVIAAVVLGLLGLYRAARDRLDEAMGDRLLAVANALAVTSDAQSLFAITLGDSTAAAYMDSLGDRLDLIRTIWTTWPRSPSAIRTVVSCRAPRRV